MISAAALLDRSTRVGWRVLGRPVDLDGEHAWLRAPESSTSEVADGWLPAWAEATGTTVHEAADAGLLASLDVLSGPHFRAEDVHPLVREFYEHSAAWQMDAWNEWTPWFQPGGELISRAFGRRVRQLALPTRALATSRGMDSRIQVLLDAAGEQQGAAWLRTLRATGEYVFSGCYGTAQLPGVEHRSLHVSFPLPHGNVQVFLRPRVRPDGSLVLTSGPGRFGEDGAYVVVDEGGHHAQRVPLHETFHVFVDEDGVLRTDHELRLWSARVLRLHYKITRQDTRRAEAP